MSKVNVKLDIDTSRLDRLQHEAIKCLQSFPEKVMELNKIINSHMPYSVRNFDDRNEDGASIVKPVPGSRSTSLSTTIKDYDLTMTPELEAETVASCYSSLASYKRPYRKLPGVRRRKPRYRFRTDTGSKIRKRPGPLGQLLTFLVKKLALCARVFLITPSSYIASRLPCVVFQRKRQLKSVQCGPSKSWNDESLSSYAPTLMSQDDTSINNFIRIMRPAAVQLIADTTTLKRWLQALVLCPTSPKLSSSTRSTETIDCWAYELFFHLKYLQVNQKIRRNEIATANLEKNRKESLQYVNLWHRLVQLRDNYIILYETLYNGTGISPENKCSVN